MTVASEISRLQTAKACLKASIENKGVTVPSNLTLEDYYACVDAIQSGPTYGFIDILVVGGGADGRNTGAASNVAGAGGGAGGFIYNTCLAIQDSCYSIVVGNRGEHGGDSCFGDLLKACGGGGGGKQGYYNCNGGSGGGGCAQGGAINCGGCGIEGQGNNGGAGRYGYGAGGGGGAGGVGGDYCSGGGGGAGGLGRTSNISGTTVCYSGGGGGAGYCGMYKGGCGSHGGGNGGGCEGRDGTNATTYGSGGGGSGGLNSNSGTGCQGVVILRYKTDGSCGICNTSTGGCKYTCGGYTIHCFTNTGSTETFTPVYK